MKRKKNLLSTLGIAKLIPKMGKPASSPGTVKYIGKVREAPVKVHVIRYDEKEITDREAMSLEDALDLINGQTVTWINILGVHNENIIKKAGEHLGIHPLVMEDIANTTHSAKFEEYDDYLFTIIKMATFQEDTKEVGMEQVSLLTGKNYVISLQEHEGDIFDGLRERIRLSKGKIRRMGSDYLMYGIIDAVVDHYFVVLGRIGEELEKMEEQLIISANQDLLIRLYQMKREMSYLRKSIWPAREVVNSLIRLENTVITKNTRIFLRDVYDHIFQVIETLETFRDMASGMLDLYLSITSNKMNEVMKVLTIFAAIFIPLTFIAGVYGMNFEFMPELHYKLAYPIWWGFTIILGVGLLIYFKRKKWL
jgi:magnesium transporter